MNRNDLDAALDSAARAVRSAARLVRRSRRRDIEIRTKGDGSVVTSVDIESEHRIRSLLRSRHPEHGIVGEEEASHVGSGGWVWYVDPLDGTRAFSIGQDNCAVAATLTRNGVPVAAAVAAPFSGDLYTAARGRPTLLNGRPVRVAAPRPLGGGETLLYYDSNEPAAMAVFGAAARGELGRITVLPGSFILGSCRAARGAHDVYLFVKRRAGTLMAWDLAPAALLLEGAGGVLQDLEGRALGGLVPAREVAAGAPDAVAEAVERFGPAVRDPRPPLSWARHNETVFARLAGTALGSGAIRTIAVGGSGGGIGKTTFARELRDLLGPDDCRVIAMDDYLIPRRERDERDIGAHNPAATDLARAARDLALLREGQPCEKPVYDHRKGEADRTATVEPARFVIVEGVMSLHEDLQAHVDLGIFLDAPSSVRFRRVRRDVEEKGLTESYARAVHERFEADVRRFLMPMRDTADVVITLDEGFALEWVSPREPD